MRVMALDVGTKNVGVAVSDETATIAQGRECIRRTGNASAVERIGFVAEKYKVDRIVVGFPVNMDGTVGERARDSRDFAQMLRKTVGVPVILWDERLSTKEAEDIMLRADVSRKKRRAAVDRLAAQIILQNYLDSEKRAQG